MAKMVSIVREFLSKSWNIGLVYQCCCKSYGLLCVSTTVLVAADDAVPAKLILLTSCCYTKITKQKIIFVHYTTALLSSTKKNYQNWLISVEDKL